MLARPSSPPGKPPSTASGSSSSTLASDFFRRYGPPPVTGESDASSFLSKLYNMVEDRDTDGVISWNGAGSGFIIHIPSLFEKDLLPNFLTHYTFSAFVRHLTTVLGFVKAGDRWEFSRNDFRRGWPIFGLVRSRNVDQSDDKPPSLFPAPLKNWLRMNRVAAARRRDLYRRDKEEEEEEEEEVVEVEEEEQSVRDIAEGGGVGTRNMMVEEVEKEHMFDKVVMPSDVGKLNRLVLPKQHAEKYFPLDGSSNEKGLLLDFEDSNGRPWRFRYSYWNSSQSYMITKGWSRFVKEKQLNAGDIISFQRGAGEDSRHRLFIDWKRRPTFGTHPDFPMAHHLDLDGNVDDVTYGGYHSHPKPRPKRVPDQDTTLQPVSEQSCVSTEADEIETTYKEDNLTFHASEQDLSLPRARQASLKRFLAKRADVLSRGKRSGEGGDDEEQHLESKSPTFSSVMADNLEGDSLQNIWLSSEPMLGGLVSKAVESGVSKVGLVPLAGRSSANRIEGSGGRDLQLHFRTNLSRILFTGAKVKGEHGDAVHVVLLDANSGHVVTSGPESSMKLDVVALYGDFRYEDDEDWTPKEFETHVVYQCKGSRPILTGNLQVTLQEGVGTLGDLAFTDYSSWMRSNELRLGLKVASGFFDGIRIREARTEAFKVEDHRGESYKKHCPPVLNDEVWRLEKIAKDGAFHKRLNSNEIFTVEDFLRLMARDSAKLRNILGGMSERTWYTIQEHAKTCVLGENFYAEQYFAAGSVSDSQKVFVDSLVKKENENRNDVLEYDGMSHLNLKQSTGSSGSNTDYQGVENIEEVRSAIKDRHSKVFTAKGLRDRRIRLSVRTAIRFYNLQDRLGYYQPSKAVEWLIKAAKTAVDQLDVFPACEPSAISATRTRSAVASQPPQCEEEEPQKRQQQQEPQQSVWWDSNSPIDSFTWPCQLSPSTSHDLTLIPFTCKTVEPQGTRPHPTFLQGPAGIKEVKDKYIFSPTESKDGHSKVRTAGGIRDRRVRLSAHTAILFYDIQDRLGYDRPSKAADWLMEKSDAAIKVLDELPTAAATTKTRSAATNQPPQLKEDEPQKSQQQQEPHQIACGSGWDFKVHNLFWKVPRSLPSMFQADNFVELHLPHYNHRLLWAGKLALANLRWINLKHSLKLITLPDLSMAQKIVHLNLRGCVKLIQVSYIRNLVKLEELNLRNCVNIKILPSLIGLQNLREFYLSGCSNLRELPPSIISLNNLVVLDLKNCAQIYELPRITSGLQSLQKLNISGCTNILRSLDMKGSRESDRSYWRFLSSTICTYRDLSTSGRASQFVEAAAAPEQKKSTTKKAKKNSAPQVVQVEITEEKELTINNFNRIANKEKEERKRKSVESAVATCKEVRVKRSCNDPDDCVSIICQPFHEPEAVEKFSGGQGRESKLMDSSVSAPRSSAVLVYGPNLTGSTPEAVEEAILDSGSKLIGDTEPAPANQSPNLNKNTLLGLAMEDPTSEEGEDVGLGNSSDHPRKECTERVPLDVSKTAAMCDPHKLAEKSSDGGMESNTGVFNHQPNGTKPLSSYEENDEIDWLKNEIQKLQEQLAASEKRRDGFRECYDSLELELWPLRAELEVEHVNLTEQKQKQEESDLEASNAWEDLKKLVAQTIF